MAKLIQEAQDLKTEIYNLIVDSIPYDDTGEYEELSDEDIVSIGVEIIESIMDQYQKDISVIKKKVSADYKKVIALQSKLDKKGIPFDIDGSINEAILLYDEMTDRITDISSDIIIFIDA